VLRSNISIVVDVCLDFIRLQYSENFLSLIPDDGGSTHLWNVGRQSFYTAVHPRRQTWWWRQYAPLKRRSTIMLLGSITQKTALNRISVTRWYFLYPFLSKSECRIDRYVDIVCVKNNSVPSVKDNKIRIVRFKVLTAASMMFRVVFWVVLPCKIIVDRRFRGAYCLHHSLMIHIPFSPQCLRVKQLWWLAL
jgi:hypothetical protein